MMTKQKYWAALVVAFCFCGAGASQEAEPAERKPAVTSLTTENDVFGGGTDRNYSSGLRLERMSAADDVHPGLEWVAHRLPWLDLDRTELRQGFALSHVIFTPEDKTLLVPDPNDRPYAAWLNGSATIIASDETTQDTLQVNIGIVGPSAGGEFVQNNWHKAIGVAAANGWPNQLRDEFGVEVIAQRMELFKGPDMPFGLETDFGLSVGAGLGNVRTYAATGLTARIGWDLDGSFGPPRIRPALSGAGDFKPGTKVDPMGGYFFFGVDGRAIARDMFLDGNLWRDGPRVNDRRVFVGDIQGGVAVHYGKVQVAFTFVQRSEQFVAQNGAQQFGAISFSVAH